MKLRAYSLLMLALCCGANAWAQYSIKGKVVDGATGLPVPVAEVYNEETQYIARTNEKGEYEIPNLKPGTYSLVAYSFSYKVIERKVTVASANLEVDFRLQEITQELSEVVIAQEREKIFSINRLKPVEGTAIYAGKKSEVVLLDKALGNLATNNARQVYAQVVGLNIYESVDAGLQLSVGGRGLDPNRTSNFNTRQNGYDISADVLGYPESYYTPPAEALSEIQVIRGAASLQYGTQFGGLINFKMKEPNPKKKVELTSRQTVGSFNLFTSFNSLSGTIGKFSYYAYFNYKTGDGFRPNSGFDSKNFFANMNYQLNENTRLSFDYTHLNYLAQQAGGLTDTQFNRNPNFSNRERNWFEVQWNLMALKLEHKFSGNTDFSLNLFGLDASRNSVGFRGNPTQLNSNPVSELDEQNNDGTYVTPRDLIRGDFNNWGLESRLLTRYKLGEKNAVFLIGTKFYKAENRSQQGPGSLGVGVDFNFARQEFPDYPNQSDFLFPNLNVSLFGENIFYLNNRLSLTPGFRLEYIKTESQGTYTQVNFDNAGNPISNRTLQDNRELNRSFLLLGLGLSYDHSDNLEVYANLSQNYRSVTFSDIRTVNPTFIIDPEIRDETGFTADFGLRGKWNETVSYDLGGFGLLYNDRIGIILDDRANRVRKNIGKAFIYGLETFADWNLARTLQLDANQFKLNWFVNAAFTSSEYLASEENNVVGKKVEFIPTVNLKTGLSAGYNNLLLSLQFTHLTEQFTDVQNSAVPEEGDARNGVIGEIPAYSVMDLSMSYTLGRWKIESGINNLLNERYFTRRATGYPGPGIIPSDPRAYYFTLQLKL
ncbi:TonB-dependent receptor [Roseivirga sp. UBA838]|uniref:TonB-dependent receptor n=1 Tax=Roseivirga sp. UBA838 TaxID=1947393 RepID=UPI00257970F7|nr:TonB-dependent receptor [Roseivirga sp. UBA838]|tara:strand:+ start:27863 stop:30340 length:2478 start_codon:yes stop_codon:yes gene_type:complete